MNAIISIKVREIREDGQVKPKNTPNNADIRAPTAETAKRNTASGLRKHELSI